MPKLPETWRKAEWWVVMKLPHCVRWWWFGVRGKTAKIDPSKQSGFILIPTKLQISKTERKDA